MRSWTIHRWWGRFVNGYVGKRGWLKQGDYHIGDVAGHLSLYPLQSREPEFSFLVYYGQWGLTIGSGAEFCRAAYRLWVPKHALLGCTYCHQGHMTSKACSPNTVSPTRAPSVPSPAKFSARIYYIRYYSQRTKPLLSSPYQLSVAEPCRDQLSGY